jgi:hypothetical protein
MGNQASAQTSSLPEHIKPRTEVQVKEGPFSKVVMSKEFHYHMYGGKKPEAKSSSQRNFDHGFAEGRLSVSDQVKLYLGTVQEQLVARDAAYVARIKELEDMLERRKDLGESTSIPRAVSSPQTAIKDTLAKFPCQTESTAVQVCLQGNKNTAFTCNAAINNYATCVTQTHATPAPQ